MWWSGGRGRRRRGARRTSLVTSRPARQNYKTGRAARAAARRSAPGAPGTGRSDERAADRPRRATSRPYVLVRGRRHDGGRAGRGRGYSSTRRAALRSAGAGALSATASARRRRARPLPAPPAPRSSLDHAPKRRIYLPCMLALLPEAMRTLPRMPV